MKKNMKIFSYEEAFKESTKYFKGDEFAANVWINKYALKDSKGNIYESNPDMMHKRMAKELARTESKHPNSLSEIELYDLIKEFKYIVPQGGPMTGIGNEFQVASLSNCFVIGNDGESDSYGGILKIEQEQIQLMKRRGGVGHDLSHIRPKGSPVNNSALTSTGIVPFMERYSNATREVAQDGRRGALMLTCNVKNIDIEDFIDAKMTDGKVTGANISVKLTDEFMRAVKKNTKFVQQYPINSPTPFQTKKTKAKKIWDKIIYNAWKSAEPGVLFWDTIINESVADCYKKFGFGTVSTNPCGEIPLCPFDSCRLLALNLYSFVDNPFTDKAKFNFVKFDKYSRKALRIMDDIIDLEIEKINKIINKIKSDKESDEIKAIELNLWLKIKEKALQGRRTGIGVTGTGDMLAALNIKYGTKTGTEFATKVHKSLAISTYSESVELAKERGAFEIYSSELEKDNPIILRIKAECPELYEEMVKYGRRNISILTIAPTGTTSIMTQTTSGCESVFMIAYKRRKKINPNDLNVTVDFIDEVGDSWQEFYVFHHKFEDWLKVKGYDIEKTKKLSETDLNEIVKKSPWFEATANDVDWVEKVKYQGSIQKWVDHSISVTVNVPKDCTVKKISEIYMTAWESGCKGITVYRDGSRSGVLVSNDDTGKNDTGFIEHNAPKRPKKLNAEVVKFNNNYEKWVAVIGLFEDKPYEIFTGRLIDSFEILEKVDSGTIIKNKDILTGKSRYDFQYKDKNGFNITVEGLSRTFNKEYWNYGKLISGILRHGMPINKVVDVITNLNLDDNHLNTWKKGIIRALKKYIPDGTTDSNKCPECEQESLVYQEGCLSCKNCGYSKCG